EVLNEYCAKTWDFCLDIIKERSLWDLAASNGAEFIRFLRAFKAMRAGFSSGDFVYGLIVARKSDQGRADLTYGQCAHSYFHFRSDVNQAAASTLQNGLIGKQWVRDHGNA